MELTIIEPDPLSNSEYLNFTPSVVRTNRPTKGNQGLFILGIILVGLIILWIVLIKINESSTGN